MNVTNHLTQAFAQARTKYPDLSQAWVSISARVGGRLPSSLLMPSIQREGEFDLLLRALEEENLVNLRNQSPNLFVFHYVHMLSSYWIGGMYEIFRLLRQRKLADNSAIFEELLRNLELIRIPLEKHEIAKDKTLKEPLMLQRVPTAGNDADIYRYVSDDNSRAHIMPTVASTVTGSVMWQVLDVKTNSSYWVERRWLSDKMLELWSEKIVSTG